MDNQTPNLPKYRTDDGYTFYLQPDGTLTDHVDPELSDMTFDSLDAFVDEEGEPLGVIVTTDKGDD